MLLLFGRAGRLTAENGGFRPGQFTDHPERSSNTPACANKYMLNDVVRGEWNWTGYILSDPGAAAFVGSTQVGARGNPWHESNKTFGHSSGLRTIGLAPTYCGLSG
jgi:hypothetical protein